jgi:hypothetical protein
MALSPALGAHNEQVLRRPNSSRAGADQSENINSPERTEITDDSCVGVIDQPQGYALCGKGCQRQRTGNW